MIQAERRSVASGDRFGRLTAIEQLPDRRHGDGAIRWLLQCDCGGAAIATTSRLNWRSRQGIRQACAACAAQSAASAVARRRQRYLDAFRREWQEHGMLWSNRAEQRMCSDIRAALVAEFGEPGWSGPVVQDEPETEPVTAIARNAGRIRAGDPISTHEEIAMVLGVSRKRVQQIEQVALAKLRRALLRFDADLRAA